MVIQPVWTRIVEMSLGWCFNRVYPQEQLTDVKEQRALWEERYKQEVARRERAEIEKSVVEALLGVERSKRQKAEERYTTEVERGDRMRNAKRVVEGLLGAERAKREHVEKGLAAVDCERALWKDRYERAVGERAEVEDANAVTAALLEVERKRAVEAEKSQVHWMGLWRAQDLQMKGRI